MQKRNLFLIFLLGLISINFASAQFYGPFSLGSFLNSVDPSTLILSISFIICFLVINFGLSKYFKENKSISALISLSISLLIIYGLNISSFNFSSIFYNIGISNSLLLPISYILFWIVLGYLLWKFKWDKLFFSFAGIMFLIFVASYIVPGLTNTGWLLVVGIIFAILGFIFWRINISKSKREDRESRTRYLK